MAYLFDGTNDFGQVALNLSGSDKLTVAFLVYWDAYANNDDLAMEFTANGATTAGGFFLNPNASGGSFDVITCQTADPLREGKRFTRPSSAAWQSWMFAFDNGAAGGSKIAAAYVDGSAQSLTSFITGSTGGNFANDTLNLMCRNAASLFGAGRMAELALWSGSTLGQAHASMLAARYAPSMLAVKPTHYFPMIRDGNSKTSSASISFTGAVVTAHPRVIYPRRRQAYSVAAAAASGPGRILKGGLIRGGLLRGGRLVG